MPVNDTRIKISLVDEASSALRSITAQYDKFNMSVAKLSTGNSKIVSSTNSANAALKQQEVSLEKVDAMMQRVIYSAARYLVIYKGFQAIGGLWDKTVVSGFEYNKMLETNKMGMAGILMSMTEINGKQLTWNQALSASGQIMDKLNKKALETNATSEELIDTFRALLGPGISSGMKIEEIVDFTTVGVNAVKALGLPKNQLIQELRGLVQGGIKPASSTLATALGLKDSDIKAAKASSEGLYKFLMTRLAGFSTAVSESAHTWEGRISRIQTAMAMAFGQGQKPIFEKANEMAEQLASYLIVIDERTDQFGNKVKSIKLNEDVTQSIEAATKRLFVLYKDLEDIGKTILPGIKVALKASLTVLDAVLKNVKLIAGSFIMWKVTSTIMDLVKVQQLTNEGYTATSKLGKAYQSIYASVTGYNQKLEIASNLQKDLNALTESYASINAQRAGFGTASNENSVLNLSKHYQELGVSAEQAGQMQQAVFSALINEGEVAARIVQNMTDKYAQYNQELLLTRQYQQEAGANMLAAPGNVQSGINAEASAYNSLVNSKRAEESVTRLAQRYRDVGMAASEAGAIQARIQNLIISGNTKLAEQELNMHNNIIRTGQLRNEQQLAENNRFTTELAGINALYNARVRLNKAEQYVSGVIKRAFNTGLSEYAEMIAITIEKLEQLGLTGQKVYDLAKIQAKALKDGHLEIVNAIGQEIVKHAELEATIAKATYSQEQLTAMAKQYSSIDYSRLTAEQEQILAFDSERVLNQSKQIEMVNAIRTAYENLNASITEGILSEEQAHALRIQLQQQVSSGYVDIAAKTAEQINLEHAKGTLAQDNARKVIAAAEAEKLERQKLLSMSAEEMTAQQQKTLAYDANNAVIKTGNAEAISSYQQLIATIERLKVTMQEKGLVTTDVETAYIELLQRVVEANGQVQQSELSKMEATMKHAEVQIQSNTQTQNAINKAVGLASKIGIAAVAFSSLTGQTDSWVATAGNFVSQAGIVISSLEGISTGLNTLIAKAAVAKGALLGVVFAGAAAAVGAGIGIGRGIRRAYDPNINFEATNVNQNLYEQAGGYTAAGTGAVNADAVNEKYQAEQAAKLMETYQKAVKDSDEVMKKSIEGIENVADKLSKKDFGVGEAAAAQEKAAKSAKDNADKARREAEKAAQEEENRRIQNGVYLNGIAEQIISEGQRFGEVGCTAFMDAILDRGQSVFSELFDNAGLGVDVAWERAKKLGAVEGTTEGMRKGAIIFYASNQYTTGSHVGMADGEGGVYHNAASQGYKPYHMRNSIGMGDGTWIMGYLNTDGGKTGTASTSKEAEKVNKALDKVRTAVADVNAEINSNKGVYSYAESVSQQIASVYDTASKKVATIQESLNEGMRRGIDTTYLSEQLEHYLEVMQEKMVRVKRAALDSMYADEVENASRIVALNAGTQDQQNAEQLKRLDAHYVYLQEILRAERLTLEERKKYEQELTSVIAQQEELRAYTVEGALSNTLKGLKNYTVEYQSTIKSVQDSIETGFTSLMDGIVSGQNSFADNIKSSWDNITNSVISSIWKMAMQMLVVKPLFNWLGNFFGGGNGSFSYGNTNLPNVSLVPTGGNSISIGNTLDFARARGGYANTGWHLVGEEGPELVNFSTPGRVYTAEQTANALSGNGNGGNNIQLTMNINTPNADSFKASRSQIAAQMSMMLKRGQRA